LLSYLFATCFGIRTTLFHETRPNWSSELFLNGLEDARRLLGLDARRARTYEKERCHVRAESLSE
jgi:hypothetical protein